mmetsp:Transcript_34201/g.82347  ORF Transcript_34201/g.82347 Transcript_34201/m.82347 type:complete len:574 (+) Transcript_34201:57-1778(+)
MYCGDETGSFIGDVGSNVCRFGYGGEDNPKYVTSSSYVDVSNRRMVGSTLHYSDDISSMESILRMPDYTLSSSSSPSSSSSSSSNSESNGPGPQPLTDCNSFLRQGESIENWDALEVAWESAMGTLRARDTKKHTVGGMPYDNNASSSSRTTTTATTVAASGVTSTTVVPSAGSEPGGGGKCIHPILAVMPGMAEFDGYGREYAKARRRSQYEKYTEMLMESSGPVSASSCFLAPAPMLAAFSLGRQTALMVDMGAGGCRVTPVCDGLVLQHSQRRNGRGGDWLDSMMWRAMMEENINPKPRYMTRKIGTRTMPSEEETPSKSKATKASKTTSMVTEPSPPGVFHVRAMRDLMYEVRTEPYVKLQTSSENARVPFKSMNRDEDEDDDDDEEDEDMGVPSPGSPSSSFTTYQLPDGTPIDLSTPLGRGLKQIPELFFVDQSTLPFQSSQGDSNAQPSVNGGLLTLSDAPLHHLVHQSLLSVGDVDLRKELAQGVCVVGGASLCPNVEARLSHELSQLLPSFVKPKVVASQFSVERSFASWIGGSILTSLGSFQQLWLSKTEYEEYGVNSIQRFP